MLWTIARSVASLTSKTGMPRSTDSTESQSPRRAFRPTLSSSGLPQYGTRLGASAVGGASGRCRNLPSITASVGTTNLTTQSYRLEGMSAESGRMLTALAWLTASWPGGIVEQGLVSCPGSPHGIGLFGHGVA